jgi:putative lipoic acid-binding regulatory protein
VTADQPKPDISYPCEWEYRIIGRGREVTRAAVLEVIGDAHHTLTFSRHSRTGRYSSFSLRMVVVDEDQRVGIYEALARHAAIRIVL